MRPRVLGANLVVVFAAACGIAHDGPPPRFADAPPEPTRVAAGGAPTDAGMPVVDAVVALAPDAGPAPVATDGGATTPGFEDAAADVPPSATGPVTREQWDQMLDVGRRKFNRVCSECHGTGIGPVLNGRRRTAERIRQVVRRGTGDMRPISPRRLSDEDLEGLIVFLTTIRAVVDVTAPEPLAQ